MRRLAMWWPRDRRQAQSGTTLVELLVSVVIMGLALTLVVGTFSTGLLNAALAKRNTAAVAVVQYELDQISGGAYNASAQPYSDCFATERAGTPPATVGYKGACPSSAYTLRADVGMVPGPGSSQQWSITVMTWPNSAQVGKPVETIRAIR